MSGTSADDTPMHMWTSASTALWPLRLWADNGVATVECGECDDGQVLAAGRDDRPFMLADLTARVEQHITKCRAAHWS